MPKDHDLSAMPLDELWRAHQMIAQVLFERLMARHRQLDEKLTILQRGLTAPVAGADDPVWTRAARRAGLPTRKPGSATAKDLALEKAES